MLAQCTATNGALFRPSCGEGRSGLGAESGADGAFASAMHAEYSSSYLTTSLCKSWPMKNTINRIALKGFRKPHAIALPASVKLARKNVAEAAKTIFRNVVIVQFALIVRSSARAQFASGWILALLRSWQSRTVFCFPLLCRETRFQDVTSACCRNRARGLALRKTFNISSAAKGMSEISNSQRQSCHGTRAVLKKRDSTTLWWVIT